MIRLLPAKGGHWSGALLSVLVATVATVVISAILLAFLTDKPVRTLWELLTYTMQGGTPAVQWGKALSEGFYLAVIALGLSVGYKAGVWNIGAEGQFAAGAIGAYLTWLVLGAPVTVAVMPFLLLGGVLGGMVWAAIPAALRAHLNTNELLVSLMLVYVATNLLTYLVQSPLQGCAPALDAAGNQVGCIPYSPAQSEKLPSVLRFGPLVFGTSASSGASIGTKIHSGLLVLGGAYFVVAAILLFTLIGFRLRVAQSSAKAERFAGFSSAVTIWLSFMISGGLAGLTGAVFLMAESFSLTVGGAFLSNLGFAAIVIAFLGRLHPVGILAAAFAIAYINSGASWVASQPELRADDSVAGFIEAIALFCALATAALSQRRLIWKKEAASHG